MTSPTQSLQEAADTVKDAATEEVDRYRHGEDRPLGGYAVLVSIYSTVLLALGALVRRRGGLPERIPTPDVALLAVGTHKLSRLITKDSVTAVARAPFTSFEGAAGEGEVQEEARGQGVRHAAGELLTCPFCMAVWVATVLAFGLVLAPRATRLVAATLTAVAGSDFLQLAYATAQKASKS